MHIYTQKGMRAKDWECPTQGREAQAERRRSELEAAAQPRAKIAKQATFDGSSCPDALVDKPDPAELSSVPTTLDTSSDPAEAKAIAPAALDASSDPAEATAIAPAALDSSSAPVALEFPTGRWSQWHVVINLEFQEI